MKLKAIESYCGNLNIPGLITLEYAPTTWVDQSAYDPIISDLYNFQTDILFNTSGWLKMPLLPMKQLWRERQRSSNQGNYCQQTVRAIIPNLRAAVTGEFERMKTFRFLLRLSDANGRKWLLGSLESPFDFSVTGTTGEKNGDLAAYEVTFESETKRSAVGFVPVI